MQKPDYIVIAPPSGEMPFVFPMGLIDLVKRLGRPARGYYPGELTEEAVTNARVAVLPVHWYYSLQPAVEISRRIKKINPEIRIVSGGFTAGAYPEYLLSHSAVDYIVRGDAEVPFVRLMNALLDGGSIDDIPNLTWRGGSTGIEYQVDEQTLALSDNRDVSWFPSFERAALAVQKNPDAVGIFPWVVVSRGCRFHCPNCFASPEAQSYLAGRGMVRRPAEAVREDLVYWSGREDIRFCHFNADFISTLGADWAREALSGRFDLTAYYEWYRLPKTAEADAVISAFTSCIFGMFFRPGSECVHVEGQGRETDFGQLAQVVDHCRGRARIFLYVSPGLASGHPGYADQVRDLSRGKKIELKLFDETLLPPLAGQTDQKRNEDFERLLASSGKAMRWLPLQHLVIGWAMVSFPFLFRQLWRISLLRAKLALSFAHWRFQRG